MLMKTLILSYLPSHKVIECDFVCLLQVVHLILQHHLVLRGKQQVRLHIHCCRLQVIHCKHTGLSDGWLVDGLIDGWMDGWMDGWIDGLVG